MFATEIILRLRRQCPVFERRVGGMAAFDKATMEDNDLVMPYAFAVPVEENAADAGGNGVAQNITATYVIVVVLPTKEEKDDGLAMSARNLLDVVRRQLLNALLGWEPYSWSVPAPKVHPGAEEWAPSSRADTMRYRGHSLVKATDGRVWYQFQFDISYFDGRTGDVEYDRHFGEIVTLANSQAVIVDQALPTASTANLLSVSSGAVLVPSSWYTFTPATGLLKLTAKGREQLGATPQLTVSYETQTPRYWEIVREVYAEYYPTLLEMAGGDPSKITREMYTKINELPPNATVEFLQPNELTPLWEPSTFWLQGTPTIKENP
jgi:hypothetical protein